MGRNDELRRNQRRGKDGRWPEETCAPAGDTCWRRYEVTRGVCERKGQDVTMTMMLEENQAAALRHLFIDNDYTRAGVTSAVGEAGRKGLERSVGVAAEHTLGSRDDLLAQFIRLWYLHLPVPIRQLTEVPVDELCRVGILEVEASRARALVGVRPIDLLDGTTGWVVCDHAPGLNHDVRPTRPDHVLGASPASMSLAQMTMRTPVDTALDLGCGCGVQSLLLAGHANRVVATDVNPRALQMAALATQLSGVEDQVDLRSGSLYEPMDTRFDLIVSNPPYVMSPPEEHGARLVYRDGGLEGDALVESVVRGAPARLNEGGALQVLANWAQVDGQPWQDRLATWVEGTGADLWVVERDHLDVHQYIETWLTDAGLDGTPQWRPKYDAWLDYFAQQHITGVSMGWITLTMAGRSTPDLSFEQWPWQVNQPVADAVTAHQPGVSAALLPDEKLLASAWTLRDDVVQEQTGQPGSADPQHVVLRQREGMCRAVEVATASGGVLGACDGQLPLGVLIDTVASILGDSPQQVREQTLPLVRQCLREGFLS